MKLGMMVPLVGVLLSGGCATGTGGWELALNEGQNGVHSLRVDDEDFAETLAVERSWIRRAPSGMAVADVLVRNTDDDDFPFQYRFVFVDVDGSPIMPDSRSWDQHVVHGGESCTLSATAPTKSACGFLVRARRIK